MQQKTTRTGTSASPPPTAPDQHFKVQLPASRQGARQARLLAVERLRAWRLPPETQGTAAQIVAELAANAALHGRVPGRDFRLALSTSGGTLRIEVTDARGDRLPVQATENDGDGESGRGLLLVDALADRWGVVQGPQPCKTIWAELSLAAHRCRTPRLA